MEKKNKSEYFRKKYLLFLLIYITPVILLSIFITENLKVNIKSITQKYIVNRLESTFDAMNENLKLLNNIAFDIPSSITLSAQSANENVYNYMQINDKLSKSIETNKFCSDIIFYSRGSDIVFTQDDVEEKTLFFSQMYKFSDVNEHEIERWLNNTKVSELVICDSFFKFQQEKGAVLLYVVPLLNVKNEATAIFIIDNNWFESQFEDFYSKYDSYLTLKGALNNKSLSFGSLDEKKHKFESLTVSDALTGLQLKLSFEGKKAYEVLYYSYLVLIGYIIVLLILGVYLTYKATHYSYKPILKIQKQMGIDLKYSKDEFAAIGAAIKDMQDTNKKTEKILKSREYELKKLIVEDVLALRKVDDEIDYDSLFFDDVDEKGTPICQTVVFVVSEGDPKKLSNIFVNEKCLTVYELESEFEDVCIFLIRYNRDTHQNLNEVFERIITEVKQQNGNSIRIITGETVDSVFDIKKSFVSAYNIYKQFHENDVIMCATDKFEDIYPIDILERFEDCLNSNRLEGTKQALNDIKMTILKSSQQVFVKRCIITEIINIFIKKTFTFENKEEKANLLECFLNDKILFDVNNTNEVFNLFQEYVTILINRKRKEKNSELVSQCCDYIQTHFFEYELSVQSISENLCVSTVFLNQKMKQEVGMNVLEYITFVRMSNATHLLLNTDFSVKKIVEFIGYCDVSSFGRKFKGIYGISPAEYRRTKKTSDNKDSN